VTLTLDWAVWHTVAHHSSTSTYTPNFTRIGGTFCGRRDIRTDIHTDIKAGFIRSTLSRSRPKNVKMTTMMTMTKMMIREDSAMSRLTRDVRSVGLSGPATLTHGDNAGDSVTGSSCSWLSFLNHTDRHAICKQRNWTSGDNCNTHSFHHLLMYCMYVHMDGQTTYQSQTSTKVNNFYDVHTT